MTEPYTTVEPRHYEITLEPDLERFRFVGTVLIAARTSSPVRQLDLNILDLAVRRCQLQSGESWIDCPFYVNPENELLKIDFPEDTTGDLKIKIDYYGQINEQMAGFYRSSYKRREGEEIIAVTQFQESDARRAFPCMDHPRFKAKFEIRMIVDKELTVISNMPVVSETPEPNGKKQVAFGQTPIMSTYLLFMGVGRFRIITDELDRRVRAAVLAGMESTIQYGIAFARKSLKYCETYFDIAYPLPKLDVIAVPDFAFGAMENWGAITFRENLLLFDPKHTAVDGEERICEVIAHEMAHQWFGNLVTPADWKYLWLNESFATYFGYGAVDYYHPDWQVWDEFLESNTAPAMARDALTDTTAIEIPGGSHVVINSATAPIIYSKGGSILRQIEGYLDTNVFKSALRRFLENHAYGCAESNDLWAAMEAESGKPVQQIMKGWIMQPGHPVIRAKRSGDRLELSQQRFTYLPPTEQSDQIWPIPVTVRLYDKQGGSRDQTFLFDSDQMTIDIGPDVAAYKINDRQTGFYRVWYQDAENLSSLGGMAASEKIPEIDRWGIENDLFALVKSGRIPLSQYLDYLSHFETENAPLPLSGKMGHLYELMLVTDGAARQTVVKTASQHLTAALNQLGHEPMAGEPHGMSRLRNTLLWHAAVFGLSSVVAHAMDRFEALVNGRSVHPDILRGVMQVGACMGDEKTFEWLSDRMAQSESEMDRINSLRALGCFSRDDVLDKSLTYILDEVPQRNKFIPVAQMGANPAAIPHLWDWYVKHTDRLEAIHPIIYERIITAIVPVGGLDRAEEVNAYFQDRLKQKNIAADAIRMSLEKLEVNHRLRQHAATEYAGK